MKILIINGPNLNIIEKRDKKLYGGVSFRLVLKDIKKRYPIVKFKYFQTNHEGEIIDFLQNVRKYDAIIINPAAFTHTSIGIRDALEIIDKTKVEVHLSDLSKRENFRQVNLISAVVDKTISGKLVEGYFEAIDFVVEKMTK